ncbi:ArsA family ATPase [Bacillus luteolus]|uniref:ArsA family ATPase n=1 Tax=Litchfieldia luteola TaxID=682179 RepID=A0ABR9QNN2_9BACI|nr:ArsA family ATPase [Cytobacillus luteolus]MBE4910103.1 ArsA family ATPase [Cytobacillus luteolus]MBP1942333.1 arsenite-transporting ATPase [Cytobacillus luteolus]
MILDDAKIMFVGGKGGVGKSTSAAALALLCAKQGKKTLLVSTDPAHNVGDIFHKNIGNKITNVYPNLFALEINPIEESKRYIESVKGNLKGLVKSTMIDEVNRQIDTASSTPGAEEAAMFDRIVSIVLKDGTNFDKIVFDTAPTGHTVRLLSLPELMSVWIEGMLERRKKINKNYSQLLNDGEPVEDPIYEVLQKRKEKFAKVREVLLDSKQTRFIFVLNPERLPILETERAIKLLDSHHLHVKTLIINKILPDMVDSDFFRRRKEQEKEYLSLIETTFEKQVLKTVPLFEADIFSVEMLEKFADKLNK